MEYVELRDVDRGVVAMVTNHEAENPSYEDVVNDEDGNNLVVEGEDRVDERGSDSGGQALIQQTIGDSLLGVSIRNQLSEALTTTKFSSEDKSVINEFTSLLKADPTKLNIRSKSGLTLLHLAARHDFRDVARKILSSNTTQLEDAGNEKLYSPLHLAAQHNKPDMCSLFIEHGANMEAVDKGIHTALHLAVEEGHSEVCALLLKSHANIEAENKFKRTPLHVAAKSGSRDVCEMLIDSGAKVDSRNNVKQTPLHIAADLGHVGVCQLLIDHRAMIDAISTTNMTPLHLAIQSEHAAVCSLLLQRSASVDAVTGDNETTLQLAAVNKDTKMEICAILMHHGANVEAENSFNCTPLYEASEEGDTSMCALLLRNGANVNAQNEEQMTPLHIAATAGHTDVCALLLLNKANVDAADEKGDTPLYLATGNSHTDVCSLLLQYEANTDIANEEKDTPLHMAARTGNLEMVKDLVAHGAASHLENGYGSTALSASINSAVASAIMDGCISYGDGNGTSSDDISKGTDNKSATFRYRCFNNQSSKRQKDPLVEIVSNISLVTHPLVTSYIGHQWNLFGKYFYALIFALHVIFLGVFTATFCSWKEQERSPAIDRSRFVVAGTWFCLIYSFLMILVEGYQFDRMCGVGRWRSYLMNIENWIQLSLYATTIGFTIMNIIFSDCTSAKWNLGSVSILLAWIELMLLLQLVPGGYVKMFKKTFSNVIVVLMLFFWAVVGFALAFYALRRSAFPKAGYSILKTFAMTMGLMGDFSELFPVDDVPVSNGTGSTATSYISTHQFSLVIFVVFLVAMIIVFMNLLTGIAVSDVSELQKIALALIWEEKWGYLQLMPECWRKRSFPSESESYLLFDNNKNPLKRPDLYNYEALTAILTEWSEYKKTISDQKERLSIPTNEKEKSDEESWRESIFAVIKDHDQKLMTLQDKMEELLHKQDQERSDHDEHQEQILKRQEQLQEDLSEMIGKLVAQQTSES